LPKTKAVFALALLDVDDCEDSALKGFGNPFTPSGNKLLLLEKMTASGAESFGR
jgi:hypothetical protein